MSQQRFKDPIVSAGPTLTGIGNGTLTVDRLTHFTTAQDYTFTCIAKSPDTLFSVVADLDGPIGIVKVGTQFFDEDLKIFLTIQQGATPFEVGDVFELSVINGTDLNQDNIDDYDEEPQKNFGQGVKGTMSGDHNIRFSDDDVNALLFLSDLKYTAAVAGEDGNDVQIEYLAPIPAIAASKIIGGFLFTAVVPGSAGNLINVELVDDVLNGSEFVTVLGNDITIHLQGNTSTKDQVLTALDAEPAVLALATYVMQGSGTDTVAAPAAPDFLEGGADIFGEAGDEEVEVTGNLIQIYFESGVSNATQIKAAFDAVTEATDLASVEIIGNGSEVQYGPLAATNLSGGKGKYYSLNQHELTDIPDFFEGNASILVNDAHIQGRQTVDQEATFKDAVVLDNGGNKVPDVQKYINWLIQDGKISLRSDNYTKLLWAQPELTFEDDIIIDFTDSDHTNKIALAESPIEIDDGESLYVILNREDDVYLTPIVATLVPEGINAFRVASRFGDNLVLWDNTLIRDGKSVRIGEGGSDGSGGTTRVNLYDPLSSTLPSGPTATIDGVAVADDMYVLFSNLSSNNNRIYLASGVGVSITWTPQTLWSTGVDPVIGDSVIVTQGLAFGLSTGIFDGADFKFNDVVRFFNGTDYWELSSLQTQSLSASTTDDVFSIQMTGSENIIVDYSIIRGVEKETGTIHITTDGTDVAVTTTGAYIGASGIEFSGDIDSGNLRLRYTADGSGGAATMKFFVRRWSDSAGGPAGVPSYSSVVSGITAAGSTTEIQYNDGGNLGASPDFTWDDATKLFQVSGLESSGIIGPLTINDNEASPQALVTYDASDYPFVIIEFSCVRDGIYQVGRMMISNNGTDVGFSEDSVPTDIAGLGITFSAVISGTDVVLQYVSTSTGFAASFKYTVRRWA